MIPFPQISPEIFSIQLFGMEFALRWYALAYLVGLLIGWRIMVMLMRRPALWGDAAPMRPEQVEDLLTWVIVGVVLGGRLGFVLFYEPAYYLANPGQIPVIWRGGMSFHGGFLGVVLASWWFCHRHGVSLLRLSDGLAVATPIGLGLGRMANFINAELWGRPTDAPWGVIFPNALPGGPYSVAEIQTLLAQGQLLDQARHPSQLYQAFWEGVVLFAIVWWFSRKERPLMATSGVFLIVYGIGRIAVEFVREPDAHIGYLAWGWLTMGQVLSLPMVLLGAFLVAVAYRQAGVKRET